MRHRLARLTGVAATLAVLTATAPAAATAVTASPAAAAPLAPAPPRTVLLINGAVATTPADARPAVITTAGGGFAGSMLTLGTGGKSYEIPAAALPYLGRGLDLSLFDVPLLASKETGGRLPVRVAYQGARPRLPGVTITSAGGGAAEGYLTASSARTFGAALVRQFVADHARGSYGQDGLFAAGVTVSLAGTAAARAARAPRMAGPARGAASRYALHTLTAVGRNLAGRPDTGDVVLVFNADNTALFGDIYENENFFYHGTAKFSVPPGHYWALADFIDLSPTKKPIAERAVVLPQFTVSGDKSVRLAERAADSKITVTTPRQSVVESTGFEVRRLPQTGLVE
jgi:hypothetical protein